MHRSAAAVAVAGLASALALMTTPASAVLPDQVGVFPTWSIAGGTGAHTATATFPPSAAFAPVTVTSNATTVTGPSGVTGFLGASTAFGQDFGSTKSQPYLNVSTAAGQTNATTTLTFTGPQPDGWGFALGDIDADWVFVRAWADPGRTTPLTSEQLGFQSAGNYCTNVPRPGSCGAGPYTDQPVWVTAPETFDGVDYVPGTLRGNSLPGSPAPGLDTSGAYGWFKPTTDLAVIELLYGARSGFPIFQLWLASPAPKATITGTVELPDQSAGSPIPPDTLIQLNNQDGTPVLNAEELPVQTPVAPDGTFAIETEQRPVDDPYQLVVIPPPGYTAPPPIAVVADSAAPAPVVFELAAVPTETPAPTPPPADVDDPPAPQPADVDDPPALAESGADLRAAAWAVAVIMLGMALVAAPRLRRH
ncbi:hypothetical protein [Microbacterium sulfonylureivorans]|uniref:hypothetical protein n=1 Tax=Microbacterium sulfonylureivorans TaxID=2486854 RepID=UPI000FD882AE|nr:hypothetical protein [Microbacterium sulfonylureivorans]